MNAKHLFAVALVAYCAWSVPAWAQMSATETIGPLTVVSDQPIDMFFPNDLDLLHQKFMEFSGTVTNTSTFQDSFFLVDFDYLDLNQQVQFIPSSPIGLLPGQTIGFGITTSIPFCPERVSLHLRVKGAPIQVEGLFTHTCLVPEPASVSLWASGMAMLVGMAVWRRRHGRD